MLRQGSTKGEYLLVVEAAVARLYEQEKTKIQANNKGNQRSIDYFTNYLNDKHAKRLARLTTNKEKYANRLQETAVIFTTQPDVQLENYPDIFEGNGGSRVKLPVYKIDPVMAELCKTDKPQWIMVSWFGGATQPIGKHQHEAVVNNFNFDYVYNYFFDPDKTKGQPYTPLRSPLAKETTLRDASAAAIAARADPAVHFFDDFSTVSPWHKPAGWSTDAAVTTSTVDGLSGNWAVLSGDHANRMTSRQLRTPLPQHFTVTYELVAPRDFTWGAGGLTVELSTGQSAGSPSYVRVSLRPGFAAGRAGEAGIETKVPPGYASVRNAIDAPGFSNDKKNNRVTVSIRKTGETLAIFIDKVKVAEYDKAIPSGLQFDGMSFSMGGSYVGPNDKFYVSNIKIVREQDPALK